MTALEVLLMVCGIVCVVVSFVMSSGKSEASEAQPVSAELTEKQKESLRQQVDLIVDEQLESVVERTEVSLDKISNTKTMEMNEFSDTILKEIDRNHNEVVFLYDMLNEKAKEVKSTVKDVNVTKKQVEKLQADVSAVNATENYELENDSIGFEFDNDNDNSAAAVAMLTGNYDSDIKKKNSTSANDDEKKTVVKKNTRPRKTKKTENNGLEVNSEATAGMNIQFAKGSNNEKILKLYKDGKSNKEIAKELSLGVGEVKLVIDLYNSGK